MTKYKIQDTGYRKPPTHPSPSRGEGKGEGDSVCSGMEHGGNIYRLAEEIGVSEDKILDFSASINPLGIPERVKTEIKKKLKNLCNYPDPDTKKLREVIAKHHNISPETILCGNGSTELIYLIPRALMPEKVLIPSPTFSEYERAVTSVGSTKYKMQIKYFPLRNEEDLDINPRDFINAMKNCAMAFLCNPNNPTGRLIKRADVKSISDAAKDLKCYLVIDEAFVDFCPEETLINEVQNNPYLIVLRSMTKFYALSGLRIGYGVFPQHLFGILKKHKEPWTVNNLAQKAAITAIADNTFIEKTFKIIRKEKRFLENSFRKIGIKFYPSDANFYLLKINSNSLIDLKLREKGILVRNCSNFKGLYSSDIRVAVKARRENKILIKALKNTLNLSRKRR